MTAMGEEMFFFDQFFEIRGCFFDELELGIPDNLFDIGMPIFFGKDNFFNSENYNYFYGQSVEINFSANFFTDILDNFLGEFENRFSEAFFTVDNFYSENIRDHYSPNGSVRGFTGFFNYCESRFLSEFEDRFFEKFSAEKFIENINFSSSFFGNFEKFFKFSDIFDNFFGKFENRFSESFSGFENFYRGNIRNYYSQNVSVRGFTDFFEFYEDRFFEGFSARKFLENINFSRIFFGELEKIFEFTEIFSRETIQEFLISQYRFLNSEQISRFIDAGSPAAELERTFEKIITPKNIYTSAANSLFIEKTTGNVEAEISRTRLNRRVDELWEIVQKQKTTKPPDYDSIVRQLEFELRSALNSCGEGVHF